MTTATRNPRIGITLNEEMIDSLSTIHDHYPGLAGADNDAINFAVHSFAASLGKGKESKTKLPDWFLDLSREKRNSFATWIVEGVTGHGYWSHPIFKDQQHQSTIDMIFHKIISYEQYLSFDDLRCYFFESGLNYDQFFILDRAYTELTIQADPDCPNDFRISNVPEILEDLRIAKLINRELERLGFLKSPYADVIEHEFYIDFDDEHFEIVEFQAKCRTNHASYRTRDLLKWLVEQNPATFDHVNFIKNIQQFRD